MQTKNRLRLGVLLAATTAQALTATSARAQGADAKPADASVGLRVSTLGIGLEGSKLVNDSLAVRVSVNGYSYSRGVSSKGIDYDGRLKLGAVTAMGDFYPAKSGVFRLSAGLAFNNTKVDATAKAPSGTVTLNGQTYSASDVGTLTGAVRFPKTGVYLGLGTGKPGGRGLRFVSDLGVILGNKPTVRLSRTGGTSDPLLTPIINSALSTQQASTQSDLNKFKVYPVVSLGLSYNF